MAIALTATARNDIGAVLLEVTGAPAGAVSIYREDVNGTGQVRLLPNQEPISGALTVYDHEAALTGQVWYSVFDSTSTQAQANTTMDSPNPIISAAVLPQYRAVVTALLDYDSSTEYGGTVHWVVDRPDPLVVTSPMRTREGNFSVYASTFDEAKQIADTATTGNVMLLRQHDLLGMDMYFIARRASVSPRSSDTAAPRWEVAFDYTEVKVPSGSLQGGAGWTFDNVEAIGTFNDVQAQFTSMRDLTVGP